MKKNIMFYDHPAKSWEQGMALGNGRLGAMLLGNISEEHIWLNEDTLWSGYPRNYNDPEVKNYLEKARALIFDNKLSEADKIINQHMVGTWTESYMPMAEISFRFQKASNHAGSAAAKMENYRRVLDLNQSLLQVGAEIEGRQYAYEAFASYPDQVIAVRLECKDHFSEPVCLKLSSALRHFYRNEGPDKLRLVGWCPEIVEPDYYPAQNPIVYKSWDESKAIRFEVGINISTDGTIDWDNEDVIISPEQYIELRITSANSFAGYNHFPDAPFAERVEKTLTESGNYDWYGLKTRHIRDYRSLFDRVALDLGHSANEELDMSQRLKKMYAGESDPELIATAFQYGRYLLISSSRPGSQPPTLQGIWNNSIRPSWSSNYTININLEMNYWLVETCNLSECAEPLMRFIRELSEAGTETARINYGCAGWVSPHNTDLWRISTAVGSRNKDVDVLPWSFWMMSGGWLCEHLWEHYQFTGDKKFLKESAYPVMKSAACFYLDFGVEHNGEFVMCPSSSPENLFYYKGEKHGEYYGNTMDSEILYELFSNCIKAYEILMQDDEKISSASVDNDKAFIAKVKSALNKLPPLRIGAFGQLQEWHDDFKETDIEHRHVSHLYGLYPSNLIFQDKNPKIFQACRVVLDRRGDKSTSWSRAWKIALRARMLEGNNAGKEVHEYLQLAEDEETSTDNGGVFENLFCARPFQIDGTLGFSAGIAEMLVQSQGDDIKILPALPENWKKGALQAFLWVRNAAFPSN